MGAGCGNLRTCVYENYRTFPLYRRVAVAGPCWPPHRGNVLVGHLALPDVAQALPPPFFDGWRGTECRMAISCRLVRLCCRSGADRLGESPS